MDDGTQTIEVAGIKTRLFDSGTGEPIVLFHGGEFGGASSADTWRPELRDGLVEAGYRVIAIDRLGQGGTDNPAKPADYRVSKVVEHACDTLDALGCGPATLVGQSRGAFVAARIAMVRPDLVHRLVCFNSGSLAPGVSPEPRPGDPTYEIYVEKWTDDVRSNAELLSVTTDHITQDWVDITDAFYHSPKSVEARSVLTDEMPPYFAEYLRLKDETLAWLAGPQFSKPTLLIWGVGDPTVTLADGVALYQTFQEHCEYLRMNVINNAGHALYREYYDEVTAMLADFIRRTPR